MRLLFTQQKIIIIFNLEKQQGAQRNKKLILGDKEITDQTLFTKLFLKKTNKKSGRN